MPVRLVSQEEPLPGYRLLERLGRGGFGEVWKVEAPGGLLKAMKFVFGDLEAEDEESRPAEQELKALKRVREIRHPYILSLERYDIVEGQLMIVMELADRNLWDRFRECRNQGLPGIPREELLRYMEEAAEALDLMNTHYQIQHLDIKPQNLFLVFNHIKVGDFGLAKLLEGVRATVTGGVTPVYAAPETFEGYVSRYSDQYSLAIVFQELLTGVRPFNGANTRQLLMQHLNGIPDLNSLGPADRAIIARSLNKKPDERWGSCQELIQSLRHAGEVSPTAIPAPARPLNGAAFPEGTESALVTRVQPAGKRDSGALNSDELIRSPHSGVPPRSPTGRLEHRSGVVGWQSPAGTPLPADRLAPNGQVIPRLVTPTHGARSDEDSAHTLQRPQVFQTARMHCLGIAPPEKVGDGALFPSLVVAIGHTGRLVLDRLRRIVRDRFGNPAKVPNVRYLYIDTEYDTGGAAAGPVDGEGLTANEIVHTRLNRPAHYLQRDSLPPVDQWLPQGALYRLPRNPGPTEGVRAFGRLALIDNYDSVARRIRQEIQTFLTDETLTKADEITGLALRTNRPRAYVIAGLGGGTGSGMFIDLAYIIRRELRANGYAHPEVAGLFLVPPADRRAPRNAALANTYAALTELYYFQAGRGQYQAAFDRREAPIVDSDTPFSRIAVLQLPRAVDPGKRDEVAGRAARALFNEMLTPSGRVVDEVREVYRNAYPSTSPSCQTFGLYRLTWPRPEVLTATTRRFARKLLDQWSSRDGTPFREPIEAWLEAEWVQRKLEFDVMVERLREAADAALRDQPERTFDSLIDSLRPASSSGRISSEAMSAVMDRLVQFVGIPDSEQEGMLAVPLTARCEQITREAEKELSCMAVGLIERPQYRLVGAEEAVRQIARRLKREVDVIESMARDRNAALKWIWQQLTATAEKAGRRGPPLEALETLRQYAKGRLSYLILQLCLSIYRKLLGATPEYLREIGMCRSSLAEMQKVIDSAPRTEGGAVETGQLILPEGCTSLDEVADRFLAGISGEDVLAFDESIQKLAKRKFRGLAAILLNPMAKGSHFRELLLEKAREFLDGRLDSADPAVVFFRTRSGGEADHALIKEAFSQAVPEIVGLANTNPDELTVLAVPTSLEGSQFRAIVDAALPGVEFIPAPLPDDISFYREYPQIDLADLPQLGEYARQAVEALRTSDHPSHTRADVNWGTAGD